VYNFPMDTDDFFMELGIIFVGGRSGVNGMDLEALRKRHIFSADTLTGT
jgi:hypothetical protein